QIRTLRHIERIDSGLPVPRVHPTLKGGSSVRVRRGADSHIVHLLSYLPGIIAENAPLTETLQRHHGGVGGPPGAPPPGRLSSRSGRARATLGYTHGGAPPAPRCETAGSSTTRHGARVH